MINLKTSESKKRVVVIGGGAAGMIAAGVAAHRGHSVTLVEKNSKLGRKLLITGKGRCNLTNNCSDAQFLENVTCNHQFLHSSVSAFGPADTMLFFEELGLELVTERGGRVFPASSKSSDVLEALEKYLDSGRVKVIAAKAHQLIIRDGGVAAVAVSGGEIACDAAVITTGGLSYPKTGSTGDGYAFAEASGHKIIPPRASLVPLEADLDICSRMQGLSLRNVGVTILDHERHQVFSDFGEMLFTHFGLSGPVILSASAHMRSYDKTSYRAVIDLKPALDHAKLEQRILRDFELYKNREFSNALSGLFHKTMIPVAVEKSGIPPDTRVHSVTKAQRRSLVELMKAFEVKITGPRPIDEAVITSGGVSVKDINQRTMQSKLVNGLYFAGEVLDLDAYTGGHNLQIAWTTGFTAGNSI